MASSNMKFRGHHTAGWKLKWPRFSKIGITGRLGPRLLGFQNGGRTTRTTIQPRPRPNPAGRHSHNTTATLPAWGPGGMAVQPHQHSLPSGTHQSGQYNSPHTHGMTGTTTGVGPHTHESVQAGSGHNNQQSGHGHLLGYTNQADFGHQHQHASGDLGNYGQPSGQHSHSGGSAAYRRGGRVRRGFATGGYTTNRQGPPTSGAGGHQHMSAHVHTSYNPETGQWWPTTAPNNIMTSAAGTHNHPSGLGGGRRQRGGRARRRRR